MAISIRKATTADAPLVAYTRQIVWEQTYRGIYPDDKLDHYDLVDYACRDREKLVDQSNHYYLIMDGIDCVGYFSFGPYHYGVYKDFSLCINHLYILRSHQGLGLGRRAFEIITRHCREKQIRKFFCGCNANNLPALSFYRHMGGIQGDETSYALPKEDQIIHFEFYLGE
jgi:GNAT superfamily N-acetyltransferase